MMIKIRKEAPSEYHEVKNLVRGAFWNVYRPSCAEHLILYQFRQHPNYLKKLSKVILVDEAELEIFDRKFPPKKKEKLQGHLG